MESLHGMKENDNDTVNNISLSCNAVSSPRNISKIGYIMVAATGGAAFVLTAICTPFILPALRRICLPYVPATTSQVKNVLKALRGRSGDLIDLGSGDGRIVLAAAKNGFNAKGVELNPWLILYARLWSYSEMKRGLISKQLCPSFFQADLWTMDLRPYSNIVIFGVEEMMAELEKKLKNELCMDGAVIACRFPLPNWSPDSVIGSGIDTVWLYKKNTQQKS